MTRTFSLVLLFLALVEIVFLLQAGAGVRETTSSDLVRVPQTGQIDQLMHFG